MTKLIGLSGYARSGKDTAAQVLAQDGWQRIAFADKLRDVIYALNPIVAVETALEDVYVAENEKPVKQFMDEQTVFLQDVINVYTWDRYKETKYGPEIRRLLQRLGTEAGRQTLWDSIWVDAALKTVDDHPWGMYVVTDCRFPNEADAIRSRGGKMIRITRPGVGPANSHASETSLDDYSGFSAFVINDGTPGDLRQKMLDVVNG